MRHMKKLFLASVIVALLFLNTGKALAQSATTSAVPVNIEYSLPYPGLLPDNPLYYLKVIRDNLLKFFISDSFKKAEFELLQANKRLGASQSLLVKGKSDLALTTLSKSGNYFDDAISNIQNAKKQGKPVSSFLSELLIAAKKHREIIHLMQRGQGGDVLLNLRFFEERARDFQERVEIIKS